MDTATSSSGALVSYLRSRTVSNDVGPEIGPWPGMSHRARVIARALGLLAVSATLVMTAAHLLVLLTLAVPIWIGFELAILQRRRALRSVRAGSLSLWRPSGARFSDPGGTQTSNAA